TGSTGPTCRTTAASRTSNDSGRARRSPRTDATWFISQLIYAGRMTDSDDYLARIGTLIRDARQHSGLTQAQLASELRTSQSAINRIEKGQQNLTLDMLARIGSALDSELVSVG